MSALQFGIRMFHARDIAPLFAAVSESLGTSSQFSYGVSLAECATWVMGRGPAWALGDYSFAVCDLATGALVGTTGLNAINHRHRFANLSYWTRAGRTREGAATRGAALTAQFGFDALRLGRIEILVEPENIASLRVAEKLGATREGILQNRLVVGGVSKNAVSYSLIPGQIA